MRGIKNAHRAAEEAKGRSPLSTLSELESFRTSVLSERTLPVSRGRDLALLHEKSLECQ